MIGRAERAAGIARKIVVRAAVIAAVMLPNPVQPNKNAEGVAPPYLDCGAVPPERERGRVDEGTLALVT